ncbi:MAG: tetratricopeptide repeat protein [Cyanobacteria bacterium P01_H01_bin.74]
MPFFVLQIARLKKTRLTAKLTAWLVFLTLIGCYSPLSLAQNSSDAIYSYNNGIKQYNQGKTSEAIKQFQKAVSIDPAYASAYYNMGSIYYQMAQYANATAMFEKVITLTPNDHQARYNLALSLEKQNKLDAAIATLNLIPETGNQAARAKKKITMLEGKKEQAVSNNAMTPPAVTGPLKRKVFSKGYDGPTGIVIGPGGYMYVANYLDNIVYRVGASGDKIVFAKAANGLNGPIGMAYNPKTNELYIANYLANNVIRLNDKGKTAVLVDDVVKPYNLFYDDVNNMLYVSEQESNVVSQVQLP